MNPYLNDDPDGEEEAENTEIAIWICSYIFILIFENIANFNYNTNINN